MGLLSGLFGKYTPDKAVEGLLERVEELERGKVQLEADWLTLQNVWADTYDKLDHLRGRLAARDRHRKKTEQEELEPEEPAQLTHFEALRQRRARRR